MKENIFMRVKTLIIIFLFVVSVSCDKNQETTGRDMEAMDMEAMPSDNLNEPRLTQQGNFQVSINPELNPVPLNQIHSWILHLETPQGEVVNEAEVSIFGGMPAHDHGMPTSPQVSQVLGNGDYLIDGVQFQMPGHWIVTLNISANGNSDSVVFNLILQP